MRILLRCFKYCLIIVLALGLAGASVLGWLFLRAQPVYAGHVAMEGLAEDVKAYRDEHGVPHIFAANMNDAARALGYIHADERLFQMEMQRRAGAGRLSEILGSDMLDVDEFIRTLGLYRLAQQSYGSFSPEARQLFDSYAAGVNLWLQTHKNALPPEFLLLHARPEPWTPADSVVWGKLMALQLSENYRHEILRAHLASTLTPGQMKMLFPAPPPDAPVTMQPHITKTGAVQPLPASVPPDQFAPILPNNKMTNRITALDKLGALAALDRGASNEWVIAGAHTESGKPILANDPHLGLEAPILWYLARIITPGLSVEGATVPGLPVVVLGQNDHIAWGFTTTGSDVQDLFAETADPQNPAQYLAPGGARPFETHTEIIHVKGAPDVTLNVRATRHGPVLSDIDPELAALAGEGKVMALAFTALGDRDATPEALMRINRAGNWQDFLAALQLYQAPPQNIVYADTDGNIGFIAAGLVPQRKNGHGLVPADGASGNYDWDGTIPFAKTPQLYNPDAGFVFNANNAIVSPDYPGYYGEDWEEPFRAERLQQFFDTGIVQTLASSGAMQGDHDSLAARKLLPYLLRQSFFGVRERQALTLLKSWDGLMDRDRPEPLIFEAWLYELHKNLLEKRLGDPLKAEGPFDACAMLSILEHDAAAWCGIPKNGEAPCDAEIRQSFIDAQALLTGRDGADMTAWRWGHEHTATLRNKFYTHIPLLKNIADLQAPSSGDFYTLDRGGSARIDPDHPFERTHGAGFRGLYDLSDPARSRFMIATGQSGHLFSRHYGDLFKEWNEAHSFTMAGSEAELIQRRLPELIFHAPQK